MLPCIVCGDDADTKKIMNTLQATSLFKNLPNLDIFLVIPSLKSSKIFFSLSLVLGAYEALLTGDLMENFFQVVQGLAQKEKGRHCIDSTLVYFVKRSTLSPVLTPWQMWWSRSRLDAQVALLQKMLEQFSSSSTLVVLRALALKAGEGEPKGSLMIKRWIFILVWL